MKVNAIAIVLIRDNKFLLGKRSPLKAVAGDYWCAISGRIEPGESQEDAVMREALEEIGVVVHPIRKITEFDKEERKSILHWWLVELVEGEPHIKNDENTELRWVTIEEMSSLQPIFQDDIEVYKKALII